MNTQQKLVDAVLDQIAEDVSIEDFTAIEEMLKQVLHQSFEPKKILELYLPIVSDDSKFKGRNNYDTV